MQGSKRCEPQGGSSGKKTHINPEDFEKDEGGLGSKELTSTLRHVVGSLLNGVLGFLWFGEMTVPSDSMYNPAINPFSPRCPGSGYPQCNHDCEGVNQTVCNRPLLKGNSFVPWENSYRFVPSNSNTQLFGAKGPKEGPLFIFKGGRFLRLVDALKEALQEAEIDHAIVCSR